MQHSGGSFTYLAPSQQQPRPIGSGQTTKMVLPELTVTIAAAAPHRGGSDNYLDGSGQYAPCRRQFPPFPGVYLTRLQGLRQNPFTSLLLSQTGRLIQRRTGFSTTVGTRSCSPCTRMYRVRRESEVWGVAFQLEHRPISPATSLWEYRCTTSDMEVGPSHPARRRREVLVSMLVRPVANQ
jgi:hypothetical protein